MTKEIEKTDILTQLDNIRFYLKTKEQAGEALVFSKKLKKFAANLETKVKDRSWEIMDEEHIKEIESNGFTIKMVDPSETIEYQAESVLSAFGKKAIPLLKVSATDFKKFLTSGIMKGEITQDQVETSKEGFKSKSRKGFIKITEDKEK